MIIICNDLIQGCKTNLCYVCVIYTGEEVEHILGVKLTEAVPHVYVFITQPSIRSICLFCCVMSH